jgi:eukaryotic-like serine/threonine-protein kinase
MNPDRWRQITNIFEAALDRDVASRSAFISEACAGDTDLCREVEDLLASHDRAGEFIEEPAMAIAARQSADKSMLTGQTVAHYQVLTLIGSGGMGDVYLALDTKLGRRVALKLLPEYLAGDSHRARLFTKEARAASALNHPNIITIHEIGQLADRYYIAMEYVEGPTLSELIHREHPPLSKLLKYLQQVAEGLTKAHAAGIVHRDLKPENIMVTRDGFAKVLDFGLAKLLEQPPGPGVRDSSEAATALMAQASLPGMVMGTVGYMSPEQAQGKTGEIDQRSDIFSIGCILYEAATGKKAFEGADLLDSLHKIVHAPTPRISEIVPHVPAELERIVRRCLQKDPDKRYQSIKDVAIELEELQLQLQAQPELDQAITSDLSEHLVAGRATSAHPDSTSGNISHPTSSAEYLIGEIKRHRLGFAIGLTAVVLAIVAAGLLVYKFRDRTKPGAPQIGKTDRLTHTGKALDATISPDGKFVVYVSSDAGEESLWTRDLATNSNVQIIPPGDFHYRGMTFSTDGNYVYCLRLEKDLAFSSFGTIYQVPKLGGATKKILTDVNSPVTFSPDGKTLAFVRSAAGEDALMLANLDGTAERKLTVLKWPESFRGGGRGGAAVPGGGPAWSPDGKVIVCPGVLKEVSGRTVIAIQVADGTTRPITAETWQSIDRVEWLGDGTGLIVCAMTDLTAQVWHLAYPGGQTQLITHDLSDYADVSLTADSSKLVAVETDFVANVWVVGFNQAMANARQITNGKWEGYCGISWMPNGKIVYSARKIKYADLWMMDADGSNQKQLMDDPPANRFPAVAPDGRYIVFDSIGATGAILRMDNDGGNVKRITDKGVTPHSSPDGKWVTYEQGQEGQPSVWKVSIDGGQPVRLSDKLARRPVFSPDGNQIACYYKEERTSPWRIAILPSEGGAPIKVLNNAVTLNRFYVLRWKPDGRAILYVDEKGGVGNIWSQPIDGGRPAQVTDFKTDVIFTFDLSRDGKSLAIVRGLGFTGDVVMMSLVR